MKLATIDKQQELEFWNSFDKKDVFNYMLDSYKSERKHERKHFNYILKKMFKKTELEDLFICLMKMVLPIYKEECNNELEKIIKNVENTYDEESVRNSFDDIDNIFSNRIQKIKEDSNISSKFSDMVLEGAYMLIRYIYKGECIFDNFIYCIIKAGNDYPKVSNIFLKKTNDPNIENEVFREIKTLYDKHY